MCRLTAPSELPGLARNADPGAAFAVEGRETWVDVGETAMVCRPSMANRLIAGCVPVEAAAVGAPERRVRIAHPVLWIKA